MRRLPDLLTQPVFEPLAQYLGQPTHNDAQEAPQEAPHGRRAYQLALQLADVLDGYQNYRADWLDDWAATRDRLNTAHGTPIAVPDAQQWQPALWRDLLQDLAHDTPADQRFRSRADVHEAFVKALQQLPDGVRPAGVPQRLVVFGVTSLPMQTVQALAALGRVCQVLMLVQNPCQYFWGHVVDSRRPLPQWTRQRHTHKTSLPLPSASFTPAGLCGYIRCGFVLNHFFWYCQGRILEFSINQGWHNWRSLLCWFIYWRRYGRIKRRHCKLNLHRERVS
jgi:exodeoxyribonuclease V gamma subunit